MKPDSAATVPRPASCPEEGQIEAFDAGWNAHEVGLGRESVELFAHPAGRAWALMAWDIREKVSRGDE